MDTANSATDRPVQTRPRRRWRWRLFAAGFAVVFVGLLLLYPVIAMHPSGQFAVRERLWEFYADALPRWFGPSTLGPASSNSDALVRVAVQHLALSALGGCVAAGVGWWLRRRAA
jgi:peptidoglycan/LPS O-acetylase OafA/YrhL